MLKPAMAYKDQLDKLFANVMYDDDYFLYMGYPHGHELPKIEPMDNVYQWAIVSKGRVIGWFAYRVQPETDTVYNFGLYSFDKGNPIVGHDVFKKMEELINRHHRTEWRVIGGNPAIRGYDNLLAIYTIKRGFKTTKNQFTDICKDVYGQYRNEYVYEIVKWV